MLVSSDLLGDQVVNIKDAWYKFEFLGERFQSVEIVANSDDTLRYRIDHKNETAEILGVEEVSVPYKPKQIRYLHAQDTILGFSCRKYELKQLDFYSQQVTTSYLWVTQDLKVKNLLHLGKIFGYQNTLVKDGSFDGVTLKYESIKNFTTDLLIEAVEIRPVELKESEFSIPKHYRVVANK